MFDFLKRMYQMNRIEEDYLENVVRKGIITEEQKQIILDSPRLEKEN